MKILSLSVVAFFLGCTCPLLAADEPISGASPATPVPGTEDLTERLAVAQQIARLEISPQMLDKIVSAEVQEVLDYLENNDKKEDLEALVTAVKNLSDKLISNGRVWDEYAGRYATHFSLIELQELRTLVKNPILARRDKVRGDVREVVFVLISDVAEKEAKEVMAIAQRVEKARPQTP
jgi:hypothetical protein